MEWVLRWISRAHWNTITVWTLKVKGLIRIRGLKCLGIWDLRGGLGIWDQRGRTALE